MIPTTQRDLHRFTPEDNAGQDGAPVYLIGVPTIAGRARFRQALLVEGLRYWGPAAFYEAARGWLNEVRPDNLEELLGLIARVKQAAGAPPPAEYAIEEIERLAKDAIAWGELLEMLSRQSPMLAGMVGDNQLYMAMSPYIAASLFLRGWENVDLTFKREADQSISIELLGQLPETDVREIWRELVSLMEPHALQRKNLANDNAWPSSSPATRTPLRAARKPRPRLE